MTEHTPAPQGREEATRLADLVGDVLHKEYEGHLPVGNIPPHELENIENALRAEAL